MWEQEKLVADVLYWALVDRWQQDGGFKRLLPFSATNKIFKKIEID